MADSDVSSGLKRGAKREEFVVSDDRLSRIETKLDQLAEAMVSMARMEEKMIALFKRMDKYDETQSKMDNRVLMLEKSSVKASALGNLADRAFWIIVGIGATVLAKKIGG